VHDKQKKQLRERKRKLSSFSVILIPLDLNVINSTLEMPRVKCNTNRLTGGEVKEFFSLVITRSEPSGVIETYVQA
jgi:hypothetical protein